MLLVLVLTVARRTPVGDTVNVCSEERRTLRLGIGAGHCALRIVAGTSSRAHDFGVVGLIVKYISHGAIVAHWRRRVSVDRVAFWRATVSVLG